MGKTNPFKLRKDGHLRQLKNWCIPNFNLLEISSGFLTQSFCQRCRDDISGSARLSEVFPEAYLYLSVEKGAENTKPTNSFRKQNMIWCLQISPPTQSIRPKLFTCRQLRTGTCTVTSTSPGYVPLSRTDHTTNISSAYLQRAWGGSSMKVKQSFFNILRSILSPASLFIFTALFQAKPGLCIVAEL